MTLLDMVNLQFAEFAFVTLLCALVYSVYTLSGTLYLSCVLGLYVCLKVIKRQSAGSIDSRHRAVLITGCDTGKQLCPTANGLSECLDTPLLICHHRLHVSLGGCKTDSLDPENWKFKYLNVKRCVFYDY